MSTVKEILTWFAILGIPSICSMTIWCVRACRNFSKQLHVLMNAQQAQMRSELLDKYHFYMEGGWISDVNMKEWENAYQAYHSLGENGILDDRRLKLMNLPSKKPEVSDENNG